MPKGIIIGLLTGWILSLLGFIQIFSDWCKEIFNIHITVPAYFLIFAALGLIVAIIIKKSTFFLSAILGGLVIAFVFSWFGFHHLVIAGVRDLFKVSITVQGYYLIFAALGIIVAICGDEKVKKIKKKKKKKNKVKDKDSKKE